GRARARMASISPCSGPPEGVSLNIAVSLGHDRWLVGFKGELHAVAGPDGFGKAQGIALEIRVDLLHDQHRLSGTQHQHAGLVFRGETAEDSGALPAIVEDAVGAVDLGDGRLVAPAFR